MWHWFPARFAGQILDAGPLAPVGHDVGMAIGARPRQRRRRPRDRPSEPWRKSARLDPRLVGTSKVGHCFKKMIGEWGNQEPNLSSDLRGHGRSDVPHQDYTMAAFADDLAWPCTELELTKPVVVGHSMGGNVALKLAARASWRTTRVTGVPSVPSRSN